LKSKTNKSLKNSVLKELYLRGLVLPGLENYHIRLPFDLHGFDCGAPDCYTTEISFIIFGGSPMKFPEKLDFTLSERGCVDKEYTKKGTFEVVEQSNDYVNLYSKELKSNLVILKEEKIMNLFTTFKKQRLIK
jgi:hypothetical protein